MIKPSLKASRAAGFTLVEILVVIGIIAVLAAIVIVAVNPAKQFAQARNTTRQAGVSAILDAIGQRMADNNGIFEGPFTVNGEDYDCPTLPTSPKTITSTSGSDNIDLSCLTPTYLSMQIPVDPQGGTASFVDNLMTSYDSRYTVEVDDIGRVTVCAPKSEEEDSIPDVKKICLTR